MTEAARRPLRWIILSAIAILVIVVGAVAWGQLRPASPATVATQFWQLLADGKAQQALALTSTPTPQNGLLLTDTVYRDADRGIADVRAGAAQTTGATASVSVEFAQHGKPVTTQVKLRRVDGGPLHPAHWLVANPPLATVTTTIAAHGQANTLSVDGHALPVPGDGTLEIPALPGTYTFALGSTSKLLAPAPTTVAVPAGTTAASVRLALGASAQLGPQAVAAANTMLTGCFVAQHIAATCPMRQAIINLIPLTAEDGMLYKLSPAPKLAFNPKTMQVTSTANGTMLVSTIDHVWGNLPNSAVFSVAFDVVVSGDTFKVVPHGTGVTLVNYTGATA